MKDRTIMWTGVAGTVVAALCCFTPVLVIWLGVTGLSAWLGWLDYVLLPALAVFMAITIYALWRRFRREDNSCCETGTPKAARQGVE